MFFIPWAGNGEHLDSLYSIVDEQYAKIVEGRIPVRVDGYCSSLPTTAENIKTAFVRANRVKSELITHKGLVEDHFITRNFASSYIGADGSANRDMVVVTLRIPAPEQLPEPSAEPEPEIPPVEQEPVVEVPRQEPRPQPPPQQPQKTCGLSIRTNLLYDAFLVPTLGAEWRVNQDMGIKLDGSYGFFGRETGKIQKLWLLNPEFRLYMGIAKRFYIGVGANFSGYNVYRFMVGGFFPEDTGYQGNLWNAGVTTGYQLALSRVLSLDFNLGLGFTKLDYDSFHVVDRIRIYREKRQTRSFWGPTQAGISLVWRIGGVNY